MTIVEFSISFFTCNKGFAI